MAVLRTFLFALLFLALPWPSAEAGILPKDSAEQYELTFWESIKNSEHAEDYEAYLQQYPKGRFAALAQARLKRLRAASPKAEAAEKPRAPVAAKPAPEKQPERAATAKAAAPAPAPAAAKPVPVPDGLAEIKDCPACPALVALPPGSFTMGSNAGDPSERPGHTVAIKEPFAIGKFEVTVEQWNACVGTGGCPALAGDANGSKTAPVRDLSWDDAQKYVQWLSTISGKRYRLPTEAEWEYAARAGTSSKFWWGEQMAKGKANCKDCGEPWSQAAPANVGSFGANAFGLHDMTGSVWEWVSDCWHNSYKGAPSDNRSWDEQNCRVRVIRGGSWRDGAQYMPTTTRFKYDASVRFVQNGFRVARDMK